MIYLARKIEAEYQEGKNIILSSNMSLLIILLTLAVFHVIFYGRILVRVAIVVGILYVLSVLF